MFALDNCVHISVIVGFAAAFLISFPFLHLFITLQWILNLFYMFWGFFVCLFVCLLAGFSHSEFSLLFSSILRKQCNSFKNILISEWYFMCYYQYKNNGMFNIICYVPICVIIEGIDSNNLCTNRTISLAFFSFFSFFSVFYFNSQIWNLINWCIQFWVECIKRPLVWLLWSFPLRFKILDITQYSKWKFSKSFRCTRYMHSSRNNHKHSDVLASMEWGIGAIKWSHKSRTENRAGEEER